MSQSVGYLRCTVVDGDLAHDVEIGSTPETSTASFLGALPVETAGRDVYCGWQALDPDGTLAHAPVTPGCVLTLDHPGPGRLRIPDDAVGVLSVLSGPDVGAWCWVRRGAPATLGRDPRCTLALAAKDVSRHHAQVSFEPDAMTSLSVSDAGSLNGTFIGQLRLEEPTALPSGGLFEVCDDVIQWIPLERVDQGWRPLPDGHVEVARRFHVATQNPIAKVQLPQKPSEQARNVGQVVVAVATPLLMGLALYLMTRSPLSLLMVAVSPLMFFVQQHYEKKTRAEALRRYEKEQASISGRITAAVTQEENELRANDPGQAGLMLYAVGGLPGLWTRESGAPDALRFRVGVEDLPASVELAGERWDGFEDPKVRSVPVTVDLAQIGVLGVVGDRVGAAALMRWIVVQLATRRSPHDLELVVLSAGTGEDFAWTRWLPHVDVGDEADVPCRVGVTEPQRERLARELADLVEARERARDQQSGREVVFGSDVVVVLDGARELRKRPDLLTVLRRGAAVGVYSLCLDASDIIECKGTVTVDPAGRVEIIRSHSTPPQVARAEATTVEAAEEIARLLAPLVDPAQADAGDDIPYPVRFLDLLELGTPTPQDVASLWAAQAGPQTRVPLGADALGTVSVDIAEQGPHTMLAGTTGAGKSVLLQALVTSLLMHNRPDELNLVLVDFKGGAAFLPFVQFPGDAAEQRRQHEATGRTTRCPHVVGLILSTEGDAASDFDEASASRVIRSLKAEVSRRERILAGYGGELKEYVKRKKPDDPPLPRLMLVFDEFARVLDTAPDFMPQLVNVAGKGRSLGMHLLLATQSLAGKLTPELKNNVDLRVSLRQNEKADSVEVLDAPDAASVPGRLKGRGYILSKKDESPRPRPFQSAHLVAPPPTGGAPDATARLVAWSTLGDERPRLENAAGTHGPTDLDLAIDAVEKASTQLGLPRPYRPLLPPLPAQVSLADLDDPDLVTHPAPAGVVPFALADDPEHQAQPAFGLPLTGDMRLMIAGGPQSGRTTAVRALIHAAATRFSPDEVHLYVVEREPAGLADYADLPHVGAVTGPAEPDRVRRLITWVHGEVARRDREQYTTTEKPPYLLLIVDGWELIHDPGDPESMEGSLTKMLGDVLRTGPKVGVHLVVTCGQGPLLRKLGDQFSARVVLPFPQDDVVRSQLPSGMAVPPALKGRAVLAGDGMHLQVAQPVESAAELVTRLRETPVQRPPKAIRSLPREVRLGDVARPADVGPTWVALGLGGPEVEPVGIDLFAGPQALLVSGGPGSGRSTAAVSVTTQLAQAGVGCVVLAPAKSPVVGLAGTPNVQVLTGTVFEDSTVRAAAEALGTQRVVLVVDDADQVAITPREVSFERQPTLAREAVGAGAAGRLGLVMCGNGSALLSGTRRLADSLVPEMEYAVGDGLTVVAGPVTPAFLRDHQMVLEADQLAAAGHPGRGSYGNPARDLQLVLP